MSTLISSEELGQGILETEVYHDEGTQLPNLSTFPPSYPSFLRNLITHYKVISTETFLEENTIFSAQR